LFGARGIGCGGTVVVNCVSRLGRVDDTAHACLAVSGSAAVEPDGLGVLDYDLKCVGSSICFVLDWTGIEAGGFLGTHCTGSVEVTLYDGVQGIIEVKF